jgi:hypothetical protein
MEMSFVQGICESEIREIFRYWLERKPAGGVPRRASIDPRTIPHKYLPDLFLYERNADSRFSCRLAGTGLTSVMGRDETGMYLDEVCERVLTFEERSLTLRSLLNGKPVYCRYLAHGASGIPRWFSRILLPVSSDSGGIDQIFGMMRYGPAECRRSELGRFSKKAPAAEIVTAEDCDLVVAADWKRAEVRPQNRLQTAAL